MAQVFNVDGSVSATSFIGAPASAQVALNWRNGNDGEYYGHGDTAVAAFGDMVMYDPRKNAPGGVVADSVLDVTLPAITSIDYGKRVQVACIYDSSSTYVNYSGYSQGITGSVRMNPAGADLIGQTADYNAPYGYGYTHWHPGFGIDETRRPPNRQGPYVVSVIALPPDDDAVYATARWIASTQSMNLSTKGLGSRWTQVIDPASTYASKPGDRVINTGAGTITSNLPTNPRVGAEVEFCVTGTGGHTIQRNGQLINGQALDDSLASKTAASGITPVGFKRYEFAGGSVGWIIAKSSDI